MHDYNIFFGWFYRYKSFLCPVSQDACTMTATYKCTSDGVELKVFTSDPVSHVTSIPRYLSKVGTSVLKKQSGNVNDVTLTYRYHLFNSPFTYLQWISICAFPVPKTTNYCECWWDAALEFNRELTLKDDNLIESCPLLNEKGITTNNYHTRLQ